MYRGVVFVVILGITLLCCRTEALCQDESEWADRTLEDLSSTEKPNYRMALSLCDSICAIFEAKEEYCKLTKALVLKSSFYDKIGAPDSSIHSLILAEKSLSPDCDSLLLFEILTNYCGTYLTLKEFDKVDSVSAVALDLWNNQRKDRSWLFAILINRSIALYQMDEEDAAVRTFRFLQRSSEEAGDRQYLSKSLINLGVIKAFDGELDSAAYFYGKALPIARQGKYFSEVGNCYDALSGIAAHKGDFATASVYLDSAENLARRYDDMAFLAEVYNSRSVLAEMQNDYELANEFLLRYIEISDSILNVEKINSISRFEEKYKAQKRKGQIQQLKIENLNAALEKEKVGRTRNALFGIAGLISMLAVFLFYRGRIMKNSRDKLAKKNDEIAFERQRSDKLLLNILPPEIAEELKATGHAKPQHFQHVTIIFADFKDFTLLSQRMTPEELVKEINICFMAFDRIMDEFRIEKIKTIGDAYLAVAGLHDRHANSAKVAVQAALGMQGFIKKRSVLLKNEKHQGFQMRVGIHTGPVIAGVVGEKKFQYDIWGDTVNTAARLQTHSEVGKVNLSHHTYELLKDDPNFTFEYRGKIKAKNKGELQMYYVNR
ncbi:MAG: adenylate/guanylate cyclase domain-containing protein [Chitinophagales bacterium]|nr:adenylate/guanylate cyclase domain-containing protein [Chitinophagales bacterium]